MEDYDEGCVFCKIVKGLIPSFRVYEDEEFMAILDNHPNTEGMTVLMSKKHHPSDLLELPEHLYQKFFLKARRVAKILNERLKVQRCAIVFEGMGVNHAHLKIYPLHGLGKNWKAQVSSQTVFFETYPGYVTTKPGPEAGRDELEKVAKKIWE